MCSSGWKGVAGWGRRSQGRFYKGGRGQEMLSQICRDRIRSRSASRRPLAALGNPSRRIFHNRLTAQATVRPVVAALLDPVRLSCAPTSYRGSGRQSTHTLLVRYPPPPGLRHRSLAGSPTPDGLPRTASSQRRPIAPRPTVLCTASAAPATHARASPRSWLQLSLERMPISESTTPSFLIYHHLDYNDCHLSVHFYPVHH